MEGQTPATSALTAQRHHGKTVLITGAGGSIGTETSLRLLREGANLSLVDISAEALEAVVATLREAIPDGTADARIATFVADVTSEAEVERYTAQTVDKFGRLDCAFLNAGISYNSTSIFDTTEESYERLMRVNVKSGTDLLKFIFFLLCKPS